MKNTCMQYSFHVRLRYDMKSDIDGLVQDCSFSIANALEILRLCTKPSIYSTLHAQCSVHNWYDN